MLMLVDKNRTEPSANRALAPPVWKLYRPKSLEQLTPQLPGVTVPSSEEPYRDDPPLVASAQPPSPP